jgi:acyl-CoA synthetase (AMP-forming)/AMP-acid ligase II
MRTIAEMLRWRARRHPSLDAIWSEGKTQTYAELDQSSSQLAAGLVGQLGLKPGDRIAVID